MNMGYEDEEELVPFKEPTLDIGDTKRIDILVGMGYNRHEVEQSLQTHKFDDAYASYLLLGRRSTDVSAAAPTKSYFLVLGSSSAALSFTQSSCLFGLLSLCICLGEAKEPFVGNGGMRVVDVHVCM